MCTLSTIVLGCSASESQSGAASGGSSVIAPPESGGSSSSGGSSGGTAATSGQQSAGGREATGGTRGLGGEPPNTGGARVLGGGPNTGGTRANGGSPSTGGAKTGGTSSTGGSTQVHTGGAPATGGKAGTGGTSTGGTIATGGAVSAGGTAATGGSNTTATGGTNTSGTATIGTGPVSLACPGAAPSGSTVDWCSCEQWGEWVNGAATFYNDIWGSGAGKQCIWANKSNQFGVVAAHSGGTGVKSYPNISYSPGMAVSAVNTYTSSFNVTVPSNGVYETTYDIWTKSGSTRIEIMLWVNSEGGNNPIARSYGSTGAPVADFTNVNVGGATWNVYTGSNGANHVVSFLRTTNTNSGTLDIKAILNWIVTNEKSFTASWTLDQVQFGFEIISDVGTQSFITNGFSVSSS